MLSYSTLRCLCSLCSWRCWDFSASLCSLARLFGQSSPCGELTWDRRLNLFAYWTAWWAGLINVLLLISRYFAFLPTLAVAWVGSVCLPLVSLPVFVDSTRRFDIEFRLAVGISRPRAWHYVRVSGFVWVEINRVGRLLVLFNQHFHVFHARKKVAFWEHRAASLCLKIVTLDMLSCWRR